jgi:hypothetical protein
LAGVIPHGQETDNSGLVKQRLPVRAFSDHWLEMDRLAVRAKYGLDVHAVPLKLP